MLNVGLRTRILRMVLAAALLGGLSASVGCTKNDQGSRGSSGDDTAGPQSGEQARPEGYDCWVIVINDDDSYTEGGITYSIALNLTATNPTQSIDGTYSGTATAKTDTTGDVGGQQLNASAIANSSQLEFTLVDAAGSSDGLAPLTAEDAVYSGTGTIVMEAAGSGTIGSAGGSFSNASGQPVEVSVQGSAVVFKVTISGHTYSFTGTVRGE